MVIHLKSATEVDGNLEVTWERAEEHVLNFVIWPAKHDLVEDAELLEGFDADFLGEQIVGGGVCLHQFALWGQHTEREVVLFNRL